MSTTQTSETSDTTPQFLVEKLGKSGLRRLGYKANVSRFHHEYPTELATVVNDKFGKVMQNAVAFAKHNGRKTLTVDDVKSAAELNNYVLLF